MRKCRFITTLLILILTITACSGVVTPNHESADSTHINLNSFESKKTVKTETEEEKTQKEESTLKMKLEIGDHVFIAILEENSSVDALKELLADGSLTLTMTDYAGMEKGADLGTTLPQNNVQMNTQAGDIILYQGRTFVIYYDTNSWSLTPLGKIENVDSAKLRQALGTGNVTVTVSIE